VVEVLETCQSSFDLELGATRHHKHRGSYIKTMSRYKNTVGAASNDA